MKRLIAVIVALILVLSCTEPMVDVWAADARISASFKSKYIPDDSAIQLKLKPGFGFLDQESSMLNWELALIGAVLSEEAYDEETVKITLEELGYGKVTGYYYPDYPNSFVNPSSCFGYKKYENRGKAKNVFSIVVRGTHSWADGFTDFFDGGFRFFEEPTLNVRNDFITFAENATGKTINELKEEDNYFFISGHSYGAAVANRLSITDTIVELAGKDKNRIYTYTYESPHTCQHYFWMDPKGMSNAYNFKDVDDAVGNSPPLLGATRYGLDMEFSVKELNNDIFTSLFPNAAGGSVTEAPKRSSFGWGFNFGGHHDMGLPLTYVVQKGIEAGVWKSLGDVLVSTQGMQLTSQEPTLPLKAKDLSWIVEPTYDYDDVEPIWAVDFSDDDHTEATILYDGENYIQSYTSYPDYYNVSNKSKYQIFYMPDRIDSGNMSADDVPAVYYSDGIHFSPLYVNKNESPWNILTFSGHWGSGHLKYLVDENEMYFEWEHIVSREAFIKISELGLHKPYPIYQAKTVFYYDTPYSQRIDPHYAFVSPDGNLITDFVYDEVGTFSDGICAVSRDGKWGYIDESGREVIEPAFDAVWETGDSDYNAETNEVIDIKIAYPCTSDTIVVSKGGNLGVLYRDGTLLIDYGQFEDLAPAWNNELWAKQGGKWGLVDLAAAKRSAGLPEWEVARPAEPRKPDVQPSQETDETDATIVASGNCGPTGSESSVKWSLDSDGVLTIFGKGRMGYFFDSPWDEYGTKLKKVVIQKGVTKIGGNAFSFCDSITSVTIPNTVTDIGDHAFNRCDSLTSITIPSGVTSIGYWSFSNCYGLKSVTISDSVTSIDDCAFWNCTSLTSVTIPKTLSDFGGRCFVGTPWQKSKGDFPIVNGVLLGYQGSAANVTIPRSVTTIAEEAFESCTSLKSITIQNGVTSIGAYAFRWCEALRSVTIPSSVTSIGSYAFSACDILTIVCAPGSYAERYAKENGIPYSYQ